MLVEGYTKCKMCGYSRAYYRTGSEGYFTFLCACPKCKYCDNNDKTIWSAILRAMSEQLLEAKLPVTILGLYEFEEELRRQDESACSGKRGIR